jgi:hydroxymethylpyrimidine pyrophosphatase-like HAD family hydrolase
MPHADFFADHRYRAVATDYDGTIAHDGIVDPPTLDALQRLKRAGIATILVTGRQLDSLHNTFAHVDLFDRVVAENGALLFTPQTGKSRCLAAAPPAAMIDALHKRNVPMVVGRSIIATVEPYEHAVLSVIRELGLEWHVIFNKGNVMVLPSGVTKATGLVPTLVELGVTAEETIGVGDAENDHVFLGMCGLAVAVSNALPSLKEEAHIVTAGARGEGFVELTDGLLDGRG